MGARVYIMTDLEGVGGILSEDQTTADGKGYQAARHLLTAEVNAVIAGAFAAGAEYVLAVDGHGVAYNFVYEELDPRAEYLVGKGWDNYPEGASEDFDCAFLVGFHARAGTPKAVLDHTMSSLTWQNCWINGRLVGETAIVAGILGEYGIPVVLASGDAALCAEARELLGPQVRTVTTKYGISRHAARLRPHPVILDELAEQAALAVQHYTEAKPFVFEPPVELELEYTKTSHADGLHHPAKERLEARKIRTKGATLHQAFLNLF